VAVAALILSACGGEASTETPPVTVSVFAAASLTDAFKALGDSYHHDHPGVSIQLNFAGSPTLVTQIEQGAQADVFASADTTNMDRLRGEGFTSGTPQVFAHNKLEVAVAAGNLFSMVVGILALVFYNDVAVRDYFARLNGTLASVSAVVPVAPDPSAPTEESPSPDEGTPKG